MPEALLDDRAMEEADQRACAPGIGQDAVLFAAPALGQSADPAGALIILIPSLPLRMIAACTQILAAALLIPDTISLVVLTSDGWEDHGDACQSLVEAPGRLGIVLLCRVMAATCIGLVVAAG
ncbi:MAG: hypothetical protein ACREFO_08070 [Acetobacteraceae bacterium]